MKRKGTITFLLMFILTGALIGAQTIDKPVATVELVKTDVITLKQLQQQISKLEATMSSSIPESKRKEILDGMINERLIMQAAERDGVTVTESEVDNRIAMTKSQLGAQVSDAQFRKLIKQQTGLDYGEYRNEIKDNMIQEKYILTSNEEAFKNIKRPSEAEIKEVYEENSSSFINPQLVRFKQIFFDTRNASPSERNEKRELAQNVLDKYRNGSQSFEKLVSEYSEDSRSKQQGGDSGYIMRGDRRMRSLYGSNFYNKIFDYSVGDVSGVLESNVGFHIVKITEKRDKRFLGLNDPVSPQTNMTVRQQIAQSILNERQQNVLKEVFDETVNNLRESSESEITYFERNLDW